MHLASLVTVLFITLLGSVSVSGNFHQERIWSRYMRQSLPTEAHHRKQIYKQHPLRQARQNLGILPLLSDPENEAVTLGGPLWFDQTLVDFILRFIVPFSTPIIPDPKRIGLPPEYLMTEEELEEEFEHLETGRCLFYQDIDVIVHMQVVFYYWFPETWI
ncbi:hypothetical protein HDE_06911 [Halotydeus destructor]|nr:hypothetical protein HDE_06911 [Halotydeus destructor]